MLTSDLAPKTSQQNYNSKDWKRSSRTFPCPVCGSTKSKCSWNNRTVTCHYRESDRRGGGAIPNWLHSILSNNPINTATAADLRERPAILDQEPASDSQGDSQDQETPEYRHAVYTDLLGALRLDKNHLEGLTDPEGSRRLTKEEVEILGVKSVPADSRLICAWLAKKYGRRNLLKVPGFFLNKRGQIQLNVMGSGLFIPVIANGIIQGLRVRPDKTSDEGSKYFWLSSASKSGPGAKSCAAIYRPVTGTTIGNTVGITEGEFKAFIAAQRLGYPVISVPGTGSWQSAGAIELAKATGNQVVIFYDSELNQQTIDQRNALADALATAGLQVSIAEWPDTWKGIDNLLLDGEKFTTSIYVPDLAGLKVDRILNERYLPATFTPQKKVCLIKSPKGSGKTEWLSQLRKTLLPGQSLIAIGHRKALLEELSRRLDLEFYEEFKGKKVDRAGLTKADHLSICLDSLIHLEKANHKTYIILDEVEQVLRHVVGNTIKTRRRAVVAMFKTLLKQADHIIGLDADVSMVSYRFFQRLLGAENIEVVVNTFKRQDAPPFFQYQDRTELTASLFEKLGQGQKVYVATNAKAEALVLERMINTRFPNLKGLTITQNNSADPFIRKIISNLNTHAGAYDYLIASPTLGTGVDISLNHFDFTFVIGRQNSTTAADLLQHAARNRKAKEVHAWIQPGERHEPTSTEYWERYCIEKSEKTGILINEDYAAETGKRIASLFEVEYLKLWADVRVQEKASTNNLAFNFFEQAKREGHQVQEVNASGEIKEATQLRHDAKDELEAERVEEILEASKISDKEAAELAVKAYKTKEERAREERYRIETFYGLSISEEIIKTDDKGKMMGRLTSYMIMTGRLNPKERDKYMLDDYEKLLPDARHYSLQLVMRKNFVAALGLINFGQEEFTAGDLTDSGFVQWAKENTAGLYRDLGLTVKADIDEKPVQLVAAWLSQMGLKLKVHRSGGRGSQQRIYKVDRERLLLMEDLANSRLKVLEATPLFYSAGSQEKEVAA